jgi:hypothetical protein
MRRFARTASGANGAPDHLDADEMNAFAEGALPPAARARYVSHLANCDDCRKQVAQLAIASGAVTRTEQSVANRPERRGFWATLSGVFALPTLRYAAFAAIVVVVAGVGFVALRHRSERPNLVAANGPLPSEQTRDVTPRADTNSAVNDKNDKADSTRSNAASPPSATSASPPATLSKPDTKPGEDHVAENTTPPPVMMKEAAKSVEESEKKAETLQVRQSQTAQSQQSYAPAPPGEAQSGGRGQSQTGGLVFGGGLKTQTPQAADKAQPAVRERDTTKDVQLASNQAGGRLYDEKLKSGPSRNMDNAAANNRNANEVRAETPKRPAAAEGTDQTPPSRSVGGHKFRRQGNSWVDQKFKSSMPLRNVSRGSEDYASLDAGLRSIAQQISGEVIVVWKGRGYLIK